MSFNQNFQEILNKYDEIRANNSRVLSARHDEVVAKIPEYYDIEQSIIDLSYQAAKAKVMDPKYDTSDFHDKLKILSTKKEELLISNGFSPDYLNPIYDCPDCQDTGYINNQQCSCLKQQLIKLRYNQSHISEILKNENFNTMSFEFFSQEEKNSFDIIVKAAKDFIENFNDDYKNLLFTGQVGTGKTFISNCIAKELLDMGKSVLYFTAPSMIDAIAKSYRSKTELDDDSALDDIYNCDLLILDDLGTESYNSFTVEKFFMVLNERLSRRKSTVISTNMDIQQIKDYYSERSISRILGSYDIYVFRGKDLRLEIRKSKA